MGVGSVAAWLRNEGGTSSTIALTTTPPEPAPYFAPGDGRPAHRGARGRSGTAQAWTSLLRALAAGLRGPPGSPAHLGDPEVRVLRVINTGSHLGPARQALMLHGFLAEVATTERWCRAAQSRRGRSRPRPSDTGSSSHSTGDRLPRDARANPAPTSLRGPAGPTWCTQPHTRRGDSGSHRCPPGQR